MTQIDIFWLTIGMGLVTYLGRVSGYWFVRFTKPNEKTQIFLQQVPGTIFAAMIAPSMLTIGWVGWLSAAFVFAIAIRTGNILIALSVGMMIFILVNMIGYIN